MRLQILGPVEIADVAGEAGPVVIEATKVRAVIAVLALSPRKPVSPTALIDAIWGEAPPATAGRTLQSYISRLRKILGAEVIRSEPAGYALDVDGVDVEWFEHLVSEGASATEVGDYRAAISTLSEALELWRAEPLTELADCDLRRGHVARLEELRSLALERRAEAELGLGHYEEVIAELGELIARYPLRESLWGHLMLALYRSGRQADALRCYQRLRRVLLDELGVEPSPPLARLEHRILRQDPALESDPPPPPHNLPAPVSSFVGRAVDTHDVIELLGEHRLVTLVGAGGVGKTRLALEAAREVLVAYADGVWWVDLAPVPDPDAVALLIASTLGVTPAPGVAVSDAAIGHVRFRQLLLVLDNCEHVIDAVRDLVGRILAAGPAVVVLATSRLPIDLPGEYRQQVVPLAVPPTGTPTERIGSFDAVRLFVDRAEERTGTRLAATDLESVAGVCAHLDGVPLAIELAAARSALLDPAEIGQRLEHHIDLLAATAPVDDPRHRSLPATLDWSYALLGEPERRLFDSLAVFPGTFDLAAVEAVGSTNGERPGELLDAFGHLVDASMVVPVDGEDGRRFRLLVILADYARGHLTEAQLDDRRRRHADHYRAIARSAGREMEGPGEIDFRTLVEREDHNLRAAIGWSLAHQPRTETLEFVPAVAYVWYIIGRFAEAAELCETVLEGAEEGDPLFRAWALYRMVWPAFLSGRGERAFEANAAALDAAHAEGDALLAVLAAHSQGHMLLLGFGDADAAMPWYEQALATCDEAGLTTAKVWPLLGAAQALLFNDRPAEVVPMLDEAERIGLALGDDFRLAHLSMDRYLLAFCIGDPSGAIAASAEMLERSQRAHNSMYEQMAMVGLGVGHLNLGSLDVAESRLLSAARLALDDGNVVQLGVALQGLAALRSAQGDATTAARLYGASTTLVPFWPLMQRGYEPYFAMAREGLGPGFEAECEAGRALSPADAVALAFESGTERALRGP